MTSEALLARKLAVGDILNLLFLGGCGGGTQPRYWDLVLQQQSPKSRRIVP